MGDRDFYLALTVLLHYLVKFENTPVDNDVIHSISIPAGLPLYDVGHALI